MSRFFYLRFTLPKVFIPVYFLHRLTLRFFGTPLKNLSLPYEYFLHLRLGTPKCAFVWYIICNESQEYDKIFYGAKNARNDLQ